MGDLTETIDDPWGRHWTGQDEDTEDDAVDKTIAFLTFSFPLDLRNALYTFHSFVLLVDISFRSDIDFRFNK